MTDEYWTEPGTVVARGRELLALNYSSQWLAPGIRGQWPEPPHPAQGWMLLREGYGEVAPSAQDPDRTIRVGSGTIRVESGSIHGKSDGDDTVPCRDCDSDEIALIHVCPRLLKPMVRSLLNEMLAEGGAGHTLRRCCGSVLATAGRHAGMKPCRCQFQEGHPDSHRCQCQLEWR